MHTRVLHVDSIYADAGAIAEAASVIRAGGLVAFPTETVYGLGAHALDEAAVFRIFEAKQRPLSDPLIVHLASLAALDRVAIAVPDAARTLAARFWPGPLTLVVPKQPSVPAAVTAGRGTVAVRVPAHPIAHALLEAAGVPIAAPSANLFSRPSPTTAAHVLEDLDGRIDLVLDGGPTPVGVESTVLDVTVQPPAVLRPGGVPLEALRAIVPEVVIRREAAAGPEVAAASPGLLEVHYAPRAPLWLFEGDRARAVAALRRAVEARLAAGQRVGVLVADEEAPAFRDPRVTVYGLGPAADPAAAAARLFVALRDLDREGPDAILAIAPAPAGLGLAVRDRLRRASAGRIIQAE